MFYQHFQKDLPVFAFFLEEKRKIVNYKRFLVTKLCENVKNIAFNIE